MNKLVKGSIAGAAGIALLLGGAGTLATWNASATVASESAITAGTLNIKAASATGTWTVNGTPVSLSSFKVVPGDKLVYTSTFDVTATGDNLKATAALGDVAISAANSTSAADKALAQLLKTSASFTVNTDDTNVVIAKAGTQKVVVSVAITFPKSDTAGAENDAMTGSVNLDKFSVTLTQNN